MGAAEELQALKAALAAYVAALRERADRDGPAVQAGALTVEGQVFARAYRFVAREIEEQFLSAPIVAVTAPPEQAALAAYVANLRGRAERIEKYDRRRERDAEVGMLLDVAREIEERFLPAVREAEERRG